MSGIFIGEQQLLGEVNHGQSTRDTQMVLTGISYNRVQGRPVEFSQYDEIIGLNYSHYIYKNTL